VAYRAAWHASLPNMQKHTFITAHLPAPFDRHMSERREKHNSGGASSIFRSCLTCAYTSALLSYRGAVMALLANA